MLPADPEQLNTHAEGSRWIAHEIHDTLAQQLGLLHLVLDQLAGDRRLDAVPGLREELGFLREVADDAYRGVRGTLFLLASDDVPDLSQAIDQHARQIARASDLQVVMAAHGMPHPANPGWRRRVFSLAREGLTNVAKHAHARRVVIGLHWLKDALALSIQDDGRGFDPASPPAPNHFGLSMLHDRVAALGGDIRVESAPGAGARLSFRIPFPGERNPAEGACEFSPAHPEAATLCPSPSSLSGGVEDGDEVGASVANRSEGPGVGKWNSPT